MEKVKAAALAYLSNLSDQQTEAALTFFNSLDADKDGKISHQEFLDLLGGPERQSPEHMANLFDMVDEDGNGFLDFNECMVLYYMTRVRRLVFCNACGSCLHDTRFICVPCFESGEGGYNLCVDCYGGRRYWHRHTDFVDNHTPLEVKRSEESGGHQHQGSTSNTNPAHRPKRSKREILKGVAIAVEKAFMLGSCANAAAGDCNLM